MGAVAGRISVETPQYTVVRAGGPFEVRQYDHQLLVTTDGGSIHSNGEVGIYCARRKRYKKLLLVFLFLLIRLLFFQFGRLARYIGVISQPNNRATNNPEKSEAISMTAPVLLANSFAENPSGKKRGDTMSFILPSSKYKSISECPIPTDPRWRLDQPLQPFSLGLLFIRLFA
jgi:hypothetical protein